MCSLFQDQATAWSKEMHHSHGLPQYLRRAPPLKWPMGAPATLPQQGHTFSVRAGPPVCAQDTSQAGDARRSLSWAPMPCWSRGPFTVRKAYSTGAMSPRRKQTESVTVIIYLTVFSNREVDNKVTKILQYWPGFQDEWSFAHASQKSICPCFLNICYTF